MASASSFTVVGSGVVGTELALDIKAFFPDKPVHVVTRSEIGYLPRVPGAHDMVAKVAEEQGVGLTCGKIVKGTDEEGRVVAADGETFGDKGSRTYWATGYAPNTNYLADPRTDAAIKGQLDVGGFVRVRRSQQLQGEGFEHIFAGGDLCYSDAFSHGERTAGMACEHGHAIAQNILLLAGRREGKLKQVTLNENPGLNALAVSLGKDTGLMYATDPKLASFFGDQEGLKAAHGELDQAGKAGWKELSPSVNYLKFDMYPNGFKKMLMEDDMTIWDQFVTPAVVDME